MSLAALVVLLAGRGSQPLTLTTEFSPASVVLAQVGKAAGVQMKPSGTVLQDCFFVHFTNTPLDVAMARIAKTLDATWEQQTDGSYFLKRSPAQDKGKPPVAGIVRDSIARLLSGFGDQRMTAEDYIKGLAPGVRNDGPGQVDLDVLNWYRDNGPDSKLVIRLLKGIGADTLSQLPESQCVWFATQPTRRQRNLPQNTAEALAAFDQESVAFKQAMQSMPTGNNLRSFISDPKDLGKATRLALSVERMGNGLNAKLYVESGEDLAAHEKYIQEGQGEPLEAEPSALTKLTDDYVVSESAAPLVRVARRSTSHAAPGDPAADAVVWKDAVSDPAKHDFASVFATDFLVQTSKALGKDVVALLPDFASLIPVFGIQRDDMKVMLGQLWVTSPLGTDSVVVNDRDGYISIAPANPARARERFPRKAVARLANDVVSGRVDVEAVADVVGQTDSDGAAITSLLLAGLALPDGKAGARSVLYSGLDLWRIYGRLSPTERAAARQDGAVIGLGSPPPSLRGAIDFLVFGQNMQLAPPKTPVGQGRPPRRGLDQFTSFCLGDGYPAGSQLVVRLQRKSTLYRSGTGPNRSTSYPIKIEDAARAVAIASSPVGLADPQNYAAPALALGSEVELSLEFQFPGSGWNRLVTNVPVIDGSARFGPPEQLPSPWKEQLAEQIAKAKQQYKNLQPGATKPPPPH